MPTRAQRDNPDQHHLPNMPSQWRSINALAARLNDGADPPTFTTHSIRHYVRHADRNGLSHAVMRLGRKVLIDEGAFREWLESRRAA